MNGLYTLAILGGFGQAEIIIVLCLLGIVSIPRIFYLLTLYNTMNKIKPENRTMQPGNVWLELVPIFNIIWQFFNVIHVSDSLQNEFKSSEIKISDARPAYSVGIASCVLACSLFIPILGILTAFCGLICWIIFWVKISNYSNLIDATKS